MHGRQWIGGGLATLIVVGAAVAGSAGTAYASSFYDEMHNRDSGKCVNVAHDSGDNGASIQQYHCDNTPAAKFRFNDMGNGFFEIEGQNSHKCVQPHGGWIDNGVLLEQWDCWGSAAQQWQLQPTSGGAYRVVNMNSGMCIDVPYWSHDDWLQLQQWTCVPGAANQEFYLTGG
jgi:hypothetical protein